MCVVRIFRENLRLSWPRFTPLNLIMLAIGFRGVEFPGDCNLCTNPTVSTDQDKGERVVKEAEKWAYQRGSCPTLQLLLFCWLVGYCSSPSRKFITYCYSLRPSL